MEYSYCVIIIVIFTYIAENTSEENGCSFLESSRGVCIPLNDCPLIDVIWNETTSVRSHFKKLLCGASNSSKIMVCCPTSGSNETISKEGGSSGEKIYFPEHPLTDLEQVDIDEFHKRSYKSHANFHLLPSLRDCGNSNTAFSDRIIGGENADHAEFPWTALIGYLDTTSNETVFECAGAVINKNFILTAAHCLFRSNEYTLKTVRLAEYNIKTEMDCSFSLNCSTTKDFAISQVRVHHKWDPASDYKFNDIALLRVTPSIDIDTKFIRAICLPFARDYGLVEKLNEKELENTTCFAAGFGLTEWDGGNGSDILQKVALPIQSFETCQSSFEDLPVLISPKQICAGGIVNRDTCSGDSGGALMAPFKITSIDSKKKFLKYFSVGIISYGARACGVLELPGIATRVTAYLEWILDNIAP